MDAVADISRMVAAELALDHRLAPLLCTPTQLELTWQYGADDDTFIAWLVAESPDGHFGLAHCTAGLGNASMPWGVVSLADRDMGMDSEWHPTLADAARHAGLVTGPPDAAVRGAGS